MKSSNIFYLFVTIDVDFTAYAAQGQLVNELDRVFSELFSLFERNRKWCATWFIRLDSQMQVVYGSADYILKHYKKEIAKLRNAGHEIGWHPHPYVRKGDQWVQNTDSSSILEELKKCAPLALSYDIKVVRMGWGFQSNDIMQFLSKTGFIIDSSAIPRPKYNWELSIKDWNSTPREPYYPSISDYRVPGENHHEILEVPMSVAPISADDDTETVIRYFNLAYNSKKMKIPLSKWIESNNHLVTITHPYELIDGCGSHSLITFNIKELEVNIIQIEDIANKYGKKVSHNIMSDMRQIYD